jgi:hypothetical protein
MLVSSCGFKIVDGCLKVPLGSKQYFEIPLNAHTKRILSDPSLIVRSFTLTADNTLSICYSKDVAELECTGNVGIDRNLKNLTVADSENAVQYNLSKAVEIAENTESIVRSLRRNDGRIRRRI